VTSRLGVIGLAWARSTKKDPTLLEHSRLGKIEQDPLGACGLGEFGRALVSVGAFQLSHFSFVYSFFAQSSSFFPKILKLIQFWG